MNQNRILRKFKSVVFVGSLLFFSSCNQSSKEEAVDMAFDDVEFVTDFPLEFSLDEAVKPKVDNIGLRRFRIVDSLLILDVSGGEGFWDIYKLPEYEYLGGYLNSGDGPLEFKQSPNLDHRSTFRYENGELVTYLYDFGKGGLLKFNISESIADTTSHLSEYDTSFPPFLFGFTFLDDNYYLIKEITGDETQQLRHLLKEGERQVPKVLSSLNEAAIKQGEDFNILAAMSAYSNRHDKIVEMPIGLNNINMYKLDGTFSKSICVGEKLSDINEVQNQSRAAKKRTFADVRLFDTFFGVVFINQGEMNYALQIGDMPSILLFDWEGNPLAKIKTGKRFTSFDIDYTNQELYTFDLESDEFVKYDIKEILAEL